MKGKKRSSFTRQKSTANLAKRSRNYNFVTIDLFGCSEQQVMDLEILRSICRTLVSLAHCTEQKCLAFYRQASVNTPVGGVTIFVGMVEGNISMYTDAETNRISVDVAIFGKGKLQPVVSHIINQFEHTWKRIMYDERGKDSVSNDSD